MSISYVRLATDGPGPRVSRALPEVGSLEMKALSKDRIKVGCAEFTRDEVVRRQGTVDRTGDYVWYWYTAADCDRALKLMDEWQEPKPKFKVGDAVEWDYADGVRIVGTVLYLAHPKSGDGRNTIEAVGGIRYAIEGPRLRPWQPKVGDWVRCTNPSHPGPNPFKISESGVRAYNDSSDRGTHDDGLNGCKPEWLVPCEEPKAEAEFPAALYGKHWRSLGGDLTDIARCVLDLKGEVVLLWAKTGKP